PRETRNLMKKATHAIKIPALPKPDIARYQVTGKSEPAASGSRTEKGKDNLSVETIPSEQSYSDEIVETYQIINRQTSFEIPRQPERMPLLRNPTCWPPSLNRPYPDMELINQDGKTTRLSDLRGN